MISNGYPRMYMEVFLEGTRAPSSHIRSYRLLRELLSHGIQLSAVLAVHLCYIIEQYSYIHATI